MRAVSLACVCVARAFPRAIWATAGIAANDEKHKYVMLTSLFARRLSGCFVFVFVRLFAHCATLPPTPPPRPLCTALTLHLYICLAARRLVFDLQFYYFVTLLHFVLRRSSRCGCGGGGGEDGAKMWYQLWINNKRAVVIASCCCCCPLTFALPLRVWFI